MQGVWVSNQLINKELDKLQAAWRIALSGSHGDIVMADLKLYASKQAHVPGDPYTTAFNDGQRTMAQGILLLIEGEDDVPHETKVLR